MRSVKKNDPTLRHRLSSGASLFAVIALLTTGLPSVALAVAPGCDSGPPPGAPAKGPAGGIWGVMQRQSTVMKARNKGYTAVVKENDSALGATCFDKAVALSSRLGALFADTPAPTILPPSVNLFYEHPSIFLKNANGDDLNAAEEAALKNTIYNIFAGVGMKPDPVSGQPVPATFGVALSGALSNTLDAALGGAGGTAYPAPFNAPQQTSTTAMARDAVNTGVNLYNGDGTVRVSAGANTNVGALLSTSIGTPTVNFGMSIGSALGSTTSTALSGMTNQVTGFLSTTFTGTMNTIFDPVAGEILSLKVGLDAITSVLRSIPNVGPLAMFIPYSGNPNSVMSQLYGAMQVMMDSKQQMYASIASAVGNYSTSFMTGIVSNAAETSMSGQNQADQQNKPGATPGCTYMQALWGGRAAGGGALDVDGLVGSGPARGMEYGSYADIMNGGPPNGGVEMQDAINNGDPATPGTGNRATLDIAWEDNSQSLRRPLKPTDPNYTANGVASWKYQPTSAEIQATASVPALGVSPDDVIGLIKSLQ